MKFCILHLFIFSIVSDFVESSCTKQSGKDIDGGGGLDAVHNRNEGDCCDICRNTQRCVAYAWSDYNRGTCWLKTATGPVIDKAGVSIGTVNGGQGDTCTRHNDMDIGDQHNLAEKRGKEDQCCGICKQTNRCKAYAWTNHKGGTCWLKTSASSAYQKSGVKIGILKGSGPPSPPPPPPPPSGPTKTGKTTRYWDCCKVSCGWNGKADVSQPVRSCAKNGATSVGIHDASSCGGGNAFVCNNYKPWAVNDQLSYGFAATNIQGQSERDNCCACFELTFTNGPAKDKRMIVQSINTGGDLGNNHFDLQIPGGGVGIFDRGCNIQWRVPTGWGARYGGVSSRSGCDALPNEIKSGCYWRFDWFGGADNPNIKFRRVKCPAQLTDLTKCRRDDD